MPSIFTIMDIGRWALAVSTRQLDTVSHNVANVNTEGYSRQQVVTGTRHPEFASEGWYGRGVSAITVEQSADRLLEDRITKKNSEEYFYGARLSQLERLEAMINEAGDTSLGSQVTEFFNSWMDLSNQPESTALREAVVESAEALSTHFQTIKQDLLLVQRDMDGYLEAGVAEVNGICERIAELNGQIQLSEAGGRPANDFRDERANLIRDLSELMNIQWFESGDSTVTIFTGNGKTMVQSTYPKEGDEGPLVYKPVAGYDFGQVVHVQDNGVMDTDELSGGKMGAWLKVRDQDVEDIESFVDELANNIIGEVNQLHAGGVGLIKFTGAITGTYENVNATTDINSTDNTLPYADSLTDGTLSVWVYENGARRGYDIDIDVSQSLTEIVADINAALDNPNDPQAYIVDGKRLGFAANSGIEFAFGGDSSNLLAAMGLNTFFNGENGTDMSVNSLIAADSRLVAAGHLLEDGEHAVGDNSNALDLADLKDANTMTNNTETFNENIVSWSASFGTLVATTRDNQEFSELTSLELAEMRDNVSAVNIDEEMVDMIKFQRAFQAAAKLVSTADELLLTVLQIKD